MKKLALAYLSLFIKAWQKGRLFTRRFRAGVTIVFLTSAGMASAQTWNGGGASPLDWTDPTNWSGGVPGSNATVNIAGAGGGALTNVYSGFANQHRLFFNSGAGSYTLSGPAPVTFFDFGGAAPKIENNATGTTQTINFGVIMDGAASGGNAEINPVDGNLVLGSTLNIAPLTTLNVWGNNGNTLSVEGAVSGNKGININQNSTVWLKGANSYFGATNINAGELRLGNSTQGTGTIELGDTVGSANALFSLTNNATTGAGVAITKAVNVRAGSSGVKSIGGSGVVSNTLSGNIAMSNPLTFAPSAGAQLRLTGIISGAQPVTVNGSGLTAFGGINTFTGQTTVKSGATLGLIPATFTLGTSGTLGAGGVGNETIVESGGTLNVGGANFGNQAPGAANNEIFRIAGTGVGGAGALINTSAQNSTLTLSKVVLTGNATISQGGNNQVSYGSGGNIITGNGRTDIRQNAAPTAGQAHLDLAGNTLTVAGNHLLAIVASDISGGSFIVNSGQLNLETTTIFNTGTGNITVNPGGRLGYYSSVANQVMAVTRPVILNGGMYGDISNTAQVWTAPSPVTITGSQNPTFSAINGGLNSISGQITQSSFTGTGVDKRGTGQLGFTNIANSFSAPVNIYAGTLRGDYSTALAGGVAPAAAAVTTDTPLGTSNVINLMGGTLALRANMANDATNQRWAHPAAITIDRAPSAMTFDRIGNTTQTDKNVFFPSITIAPRSASNAWSIGQNQFTFTQGNTHRLEFTNLSMGNDTLLTTGDFTFSGDVTSAGRNSLLKNGGNSWGFIGGSTQEFNSLFIVGNTQTRVGSMYGTAVTSNTATAGTGPIFQAPNNSITFRDTGNIAAGQIVEIKSQTQTQSTVNFENNWTAVPSNLRAAGGGVLGVGNATNFGPVNLYNLGDGTFRIGAGFGGTASGAISGAITPGAGGVVRTGGGNTVNITGVNSITGTGTALEVGSDLINGGFRTNFNGGAQNGTTVLTQANNYTGATVVNRSSVLTLQAANAAGTGAITTYGTINLSGTGGTLASGTANTNTVNFRPGSILTMDNTAGNLDRWGDAVAIPLNSTALRLIGNNNASGTTETVGAVSVAGNSNIHVARTTAGNTTLAAGNLTRTGTGIATISTGGAGTLGGVDRLTVTNGSAFQTGGANVVGATDVVKPWLVNTTDKAYLTYGASGFASKAFNVNFSAAAAAPAWANTDVVNVSAAPTNAISQDILGLKTSVALSPASTSGTSGTAAFQGVANATTWNIRTGGLFHTGAANTVVTPAISFAASTGGAAVEGFLYNDNTIDMGTLQVTSTTVTAYTNISTDGVITAGAGLVKAGAGSLRLNSVQNITGGVTIQNGNVELRNPTNTTTISPLGTNTITFGGNASNASPSLNLRATASQTFNNPIVMAAELPLATIDSNNSGNGTPTIGLPSLTMNGSTHAQGQSLNISGANTLNFNGAAASPALALGSGGSFTINNAITTQISTGTNQGITFNTATPTTLIKAGAGNLILGNASTNNPAAGSRAVVNGGTLELRSITSLGSGANTTIELNTGTLNLRRDSAATYGGTAATGYTTRVNGNSTISVDRVSAGNVNVGLGKLIVNNDAQVTVNHGNNFGLIFENGADLRGSGLIVSNITGIQNQDTALRMNAAVTGGSLVKLGGGHLHLMATSTFDGGLYANAGYTRLRAAGAAGTGTVVLNPGATLDFNAANNLNVGQQVIVRSTPAAMAMISMNADVAHPTAGVDTTNATTGIIGLSNSPTGIYNTAINMASLYGGGWSLGGVSQGAYDPRYTAASLGAGSGNLYRLGGGGTSFFLGFNAASAPQNNVLTGAANSVRIGFDSGNIYTGSSGTAGNYQFTLGGSNDYGGSTVIHRGTAARSLAAVTGSNSAFSSGAVDVFGSLILSGTGTLVDGSGNATNALTLHPGSSLVLDNNGSAQAVAVTNLGDRIANAQAIDLKGSLIDLIGNSNNPSTETLGTVTIGASSRLRAARNGTGTTALTITNLAGTTTAGNSLLLQASAAAQLGLPAGDRIIASNLGTVAMVDPRVVNYTDGQFVGHDATNGFVNLTGSTNVTGGAAQLPAGLAPSTNLNIAATGTQTLSDNMVINSLRTDRDVANGGPFNRITLRSGGLLTATNGLTIQPDLVFNDGTNNIEARITAISNLFIQGQLTANGITKAGAGQMFVRVPQPNYASGWTLNSGDLIFDDPQAAGQSVAANAINVNGSTSTGGLNTAAGFGNLLSSNLGASTRLIFRYDNQSPENITFTGGPINVLNDATIQITPFGVATNGTANDRNMSIPAISLASDSTLSSAGLNIDIPNSRNRSVTPSLTLNSNGTLRVLDGGSTGDYGRINSFAVNSLVGSGKNLLKIGNRPLELRNDNSATYTGGSINIGQGTVVVGHNGSLGSTSTAVTIERNATLEIAKSVFAPVNTSFTQNAGSSERWDQEDARVATGGTYNLPAGVNLQLNTNILNARTIGLNGGTVEGFLYTDHVVQANLRTMESGVTLKLLANSYLGNALYAQGATYDTGRQPTNSAANPFGDTYTGSMLDIRGAITGAFDLTKTGLDTVQISGTSNTFNNTRVDMGILRIGANNALPTGKALVTRNGGIFDLYGFNQTVGELGTGTAYTGGGITVGSSGKITNSGVVLNTLTASQATDTTYNGLIERNVSVAKSGAGVLTLGNSDNTYRGTTTISGGTLSVSKLANGSTTGNDLTSSIGQSTSDAANVVLSGGGILRYTGGTASTDRQFTLGDTGGGFESNGSGPLTLSSTATVTHTGSAARTLTLSGSNTGANTFAGVLGNGTGTSSLTKDGTGKWTISGVSTYSGTTTVKNGTLTLAAAADIPNTTSIDVKTGATLDVSALSSLNVNGADVTVNGTITGGITSTTGTDLFGNGSITGPVDFSGATSVNTVNPGNSPGTLSTGSFTTTGGANATVFNFEIGGVIPGTDFDRISTTGAINLNGGTLVVSLINSFVPVDGTTFDIWLNDGSDAIGGSLTTFDTLANNSTFGVPETTDPYDYWSINYFTNADGGTTGNDIRLVYVPEPSSALLGAGAGLLALRRRRIRRES